MRIPRLRIIGTSAGGVTHYDLTADAGSYALTGTAATLTATRELSAAAGSYALTGTAATLKADRELAAGAGSYGLSGTGVTLAYGHNIPAESGSYSLSGTAATLTATRELAADAGNYPLNGTDATLTYVAGYALTAEAGSYGLSGTAAALAAGRKLSVDAGSYGLSGADATLTTTRELSAEAGSYPLSGADATLTYGQVVAYELTAESGSYALTGVSSSLRYTKAKLTEIKELTLAPPPSMVTLLDKQGRNDRTWIKWFFSLYEQVVENMSNDCCPITSIKAGKLFYGDSVITGVSDNAEEEWLIVTGAAESLLEMSFGSEGTFETTFYEDTTTSDDGTVQTNYNFRRSSSNTISTLVYYTPTVSANGTDISSEIHFGGTKAHATPSGGDGSIFLKANSKYLVNYKNVSGNLTDVSFGWSINEQ